MMCHWCALLQSLVQVMPARHALERNVQSVSSACLGCLLKLSASVFPFGLSLPLWASLDEVLLLSDLERRVRAGCC